MAKHVCGVVEGTLCNSSMQHSLKIEVFFGLEKILNFDNVEPRFRLGALGCVGCGHVRSGVSNGTVRPVEIVM